MQWGPFPWGMGGSPQNDLLADTVFGSRIRH